MSVLQKRRTRQSKIRNAYSRRSILKFRKKPVVIDAVLFRAGEQDGDLAADVLAGTVRYMEDGTMSILTLEGVVIAQPGDWIIRGVKGELYPCKPDIFAATYEPA